jgi:transmembrane sensor
MPPRTPKPSVNRLIVEEAAMWFVELESNEVSLATRNTFDEWLRRSPEHVRAFLEFLPLWEDAASVPAGANANPERLIAEFLSGKANIVAFHAVAKETCQPPATIERRRRHSGRLLGIAASIVLIACGLLIGYHYQRDVYVTGVGEQRSLVLADGSTVALNARSKIRVRFTLEERDVELLAGQALFEVAKNPSRPFVVYSDGARVRAVGTQFDVNRKSSATIVTVIEGRVAVTAGLLSSLHSNSNENERSGSTAPAGEPVLELSSGEQVTLTASAPARLTRANLAAATAWTQHRLTFQKTSLADVIEEFNRYNTRPLRIESSSLEAFLVSGTFSSTDPASLLRFLRAQPGIRVIETARETRIVADQQRPASP